MSRVSGNSRGRVKGRKFSANLHVSITPAQRAKLDSVSELSGLPLSYLVRRMIDDLEIST